MTTVARLTLDRPLKGKGPQMKYGDVAGANVPDAQRERRDLVLATLRTDALTAAELTDRLRDRVRDYTYNLCTSDLRQLERYNLVHSIGHPKRWSAAAREFGRSWTLREARQWLAEHAEAARALGWGLALCGSTVLQGRGRDLDVIAVPNAPDAANLPELWDASEWNAVHQRVTSPTGVECRVYEDGEGRLIDITFFPLRPVHPDIQVKMRERKRGRMALDKHNQDDMRRLVEELTAIEQRLRDLLKNGPFGTPDEIVEIQTPTPRGMADIPRALHHVEAVRRRIVAGYPTGLR